MSIPKKGTRKIIVREEPFIWLIRRKATYSQSAYLGGCLNIAIEHAQEPGSNLIIATNRLHPAGFILTQINSIIPSDIHIWIEQALAMGWMPKESGKPFYVAVVEGNFKRPKFYAKFDRLQHLLPYFERMSLGKFLMLQS
jgi:hypothetical protein